MKMIDARQIQPKDKHTSIINMFNTLIENEKMELINDHDPKPLYYQFKAEIPNQFEWEYLEKGPDVWKIVITKK